MNERASPLVVDLDALWKSQLEALAERERRVIVQEREVESERMTVEAQRSTALAAMCILSFVAFMGGLALGVVVA